MISFLFDETSVKTADFLVCVTVFIIFIRELRKIFAAKCA